MCHYNVAGDMTQAAATTRASCPKSGAIINVVIHSGRCRNTLANRWLD
mgnify:CR=1 FL=1